MLNISQKNNLSSYISPTTEHLAAIKQSVLDSYILVQQKKLKKSAKVAKRAEFSKRCKAIKQQKRIKDLLKTLKSKSYKRTRLKRYLSFLKKQKSFFQNQKFKKRIRLHLKKKFHPLFKKAFKKKRFNNSRFRLPKNLPNLFSYSLSISIKKNNIFCSFSSIQDKHKTLISSNAGSYKIKITKKTLRYTYKSVLNKFYSNVQKKYFPKRKKKAKVNKKKVKQLKIERVKAKEKAEIQRARAKAQAKVQKVKLRAKLKLKGKLKVKVRVKRTAKEKLKSKVFVARQKMKKEKDKKGLIATLIIPRRLKRKVIRSIRDKFVRIPLLIKVVDKKVFNGCRAPKSIRKKRRRRLRLYK